MKIFFGEPQFYSGEPLRRHLRELVEGAGAIEIASAWVSWSGTLDLLLGARIDLKIRATVGVGGYQTDPLILQKLGTHANVSLKIYGDPVGPLFHPKLYGFQRAHFRRCLIGSMNLTNAGTTSNVESMLSFDDRDNKALVEFERFWNSDRSVPFAAFDLKAYEIARKARLAAIKDAGASDVLDQDVAASAQSGYEADILMEDWAAFVLKLRAIPNGIEGYTRVLSKRQQFLGRNWSSDFSEADLDFMFGVHPYAAYGRLVQLKQSQAQYQGENNRWKRRQMGEALAAAAKLQGLEKPLVKKVVTQLLEIPFCKAALATRLLVIARPDFFVVVNRKSFEGLRDRFRFLGSDHDFDANKYVDLLEKIHSQPWYRSPEPEDQIEKQLWVARASLVDMLVYREKPGEDA